MHAACVLLTVLRVLLDVDGYSYRARCDGPDIHVIAFPRANCLGEPDDSETISNTTCLSLGEDNSMTVDCSPAVVEPTNAPNKDANEQAETDGCLRVHFASDNCPGAANTSGCGCLSPPECKLLPPQ